VNPSQTPPSRKIDLPYEFIGFPVKKVRPAPEETDSVGLTTATARVLLAPVEGAGGRAEQVSRRLGAAIRLGLLIDGERLPAEPRLAAQLGVSTVTLREALGTLREQGLVVTRRGRGGGTFICSPSDSREPLASFGVHELQELGDQRAAIAGTAAQLAAERALEEEMDRLDEQVGRLAAATTASERRRADTQLTIAIAAAAQSSRLTREEARLRAEIGDLLGLELTEREHREIVRARRRLTEAIRRRRAGRARRLAELRVAAETERVIGLRLEMIGAGAGAERSASVGALEDVVAELERIFEQLEGLARRFGELLDTAGPELRSGDLEAARPSIFSILESHGDLVSGAGLVIAPDLLADAERWMEWWSRPRAGAEPERLRVNLEPSAPDFYDYTTTDWFSTPERSLEPRMSGPFVDYACTNMYALTLSLPMSLAGAFRGVAAADVLVSSLESRVLPRLAGFDRPVALTTADGRVITANEASLASGRRLGPKSRSATRLSRKPPLDTLVLVEL
jgi:GntR family transcriptional regulator, transcriptional repressor for pyruvate dehydrogenase complex